jgi:hypothetical protein
METVTCDHVMVDGRLSDRRYGESFCVTWSVISCPGANR